MKQYMNRGEQIREKVGNTFAKSLFWPARPRSSKPRQNFSDIFSKILTYSSSNFIKKNFHGLQKQQLQYYVMSKSICKIFFFCKDFRGNALNVWPRKSILGLDDQDLYLRVQQYRFIFKVSVCLSILRYFSVANKLSFFNYLPKYFPTK